MKKLMFLMLMVTPLIATATLAKTRDWKPATVVVLSETDVSWPLWGAKNTMHYSIETTDMVYLAEFNYRPDQHNNGRGPDLVLNVPTKVAIEGRHAYVVDVAGKEVKLHIVKKTKK
ncbi:MAG TPA: hypothetical protein VJW94_10905 [Candidatus Acidoferrum sp.]|nr:hypothetical protein [Candidatus Acidoferrum sp.]